MLCVVRGCFVFLVDLLSVVFLFYRCCVLWASLSRGLVHRSVVYMSLSRYCFIFIWGVCLREAEFLFVQCCFFFSLRVGVIAVLYVFFSSFFSSGFSPLGVVLGKLCVCLFAFLFFFFRWFIVHVREGSLNAGGLRGGSLMLVLAPVRFSIPCHQPHSSACVTQSKMKP